MQDKDILDLFFVRDEKALQETDKKYRAMLLRIAANITNNKDDAEECLNDCYLAAWDAIPPDRPDHFFAWLAKVMRNKACKLVEKRTREKRSAQTVELTKELAECLPSEGDVFATLEQENLSAVIDGFVRTLDHDARYVFMRRYFYSDPLFDIAKATGFSESKIKSILFRTRKKLKETLEKEDLKV